MNKLEIWLIITILSGLVINARHSCQKMKSPIFVSCVDNNPEIFKSWQGIYVIDKIEYSVKNVSFSLVDSLEDFDELIISSKWQDNLVTCQQIATCFIGGEKWDIIWWYTQFGECTLKGLSLKKYIMFKSDENCPMDVEIYLLLINSF